MEVLVTGSSGFIGKNLLERLSRIENVKIHTFDIEDKLEDLEKIIDKIQNQRNEEINEMIIEYFKRRQEMLNLSKNLK